MKGPTNYKVESSDDDDDDPNIKKAKKKLKEMMQEDSDAESDFEKELLKEEAAHNGADSSDEDQKGNSSLLGKRSHGHLNLSESDSSDEDEKYSPPAKANKSQDHLLKSSYFSSAVLSDNAVVDEDVDASQRLVALAGNLEAVKNVWKEKGGEGKDRQEDENKKALESSFDLEISTLLAQGEGESMDDADHQEDDQIQSKPAATSGTGGVEVTIALPDNQRRKKL